LGTISKNLLG